MGLQGKSSEVGCRSNTALVVNILGVQSQVMLLRILWHLVIHLIPLSLCVGPCEPLQDAILRDLWTWLICNKLNSQSLSPDVYVLIDTFT